jgi:hypothetical protein
MLRKRNMIIIMKNEYDSFMRKQEIRTIRSSSSMLKNLRKKALKTDPRARIMLLDGVPTLVIHQTEAPGVVTVCLVEKETETR